MDRDEWTAEEAARRDQVLALVRDYTSKGKTIPYIRHGSFSGVAEPYRYAFEGEEDLLHLIIERCDGSSLTEDETRALARFLLPGVPEAMIWLRPGKQAHHYYLAHDILLTRP